MSESKDKEEEKPVVAKTAVDLQRLKLMKLMKNPDKPVILPERPKAKNTPTVPEFVRNVMGSSAGAGSGEFHVYRHLRRKEYARQKFIQEKGRKELLDAEYHKKLEENRKVADEMTARKRAKRLKKKQKWKQRKRSKNATAERKADGDENTEESSSEEETQDDQNASDDNIKENRIANSSAMEDSNESMNCDQNVDQNECPEGESNMTNKGEECVPQEEVSRKECTKEGPLDGCEDDNRNIECVQTEQRDSSADDQCQSENGT